MVIPSHLTEAPSAELLLRANAITKNFSGVQALKRASLELRKGEVHALIGENGAGKSTLIKIITGAITADSGTLEVAGQVLPRNDPNIAHSLGISAIYQQPSLFPHLSIAENIALSLERDSSSWTVNWKARRTRAQELIESLGAPMDARRLAGSLSMAEQQIVEIAKAVGANARILVMDEPTALLTDREVNNLFELTRTLRASRVGIIYISHRLEEISAIADRITVMRDGETIACRATGDVDHSELIQMMVGRSVESIYPKRQVAIGEVALEVRNLQNSAAGLHDISFAVRRGEIFGLAGLVGSGRTELAQTLFGLQPSESSIFLRGKPIQINSPAQAIHEGLAYVPEDRRQHGVVLEMEIAQNISLASLGAVSQWGLIEPKKENDLAKHYVDNLRIKTSSIFTPCANLSGGNQQKVALARWLATKPDVIILDEPTQGVDVGSKAEIHHLIMEMAERGIAILLISSELPEILGMSDRIGVLHAGTLAGVLSREEATQENVTSLAFGHGLNG
jgi:ABC-type sugar transport system ATPase subunit